MLSLRMLVGFNLVGLLIYMVIYCIPEPEPNQFSDEYYTRQCKYDTETLCPDCFLKPVNCDLFTENITFKGLGAINEYVDPLNLYLNRRGILNRMEQVVIKSFNSNRTFEMLRDTICNELNINPENCSLSNNGKILQKLRQRLLSEDPPEDIRFCPPGDERGLKRFVEVFAHPELLTLVMMNTNIYPLVMLLLYTHNKPVPSFVFSQGFLLVESHNGSKLSTYYNDTLNTRLRITYELINTFFEFDSEVRFFRFYLTDIDPDNFVVIGSRRKIEKILFADLRNVIVHNSLTEKQDPDKQYYVHSRSKCGDCFGYSQEEVCFYHYTDINLFAVCQLLMEGHFWKADDGFLHNDEESDEFDRLASLLYLCTYCDKTDCQDRYKVLKQIQQVILTILN